ncbi:hypothetical protein D1007_01588 [Hordeum vulgare]|nr:hypothetical protein D1007_01588 [Hordeum vulgare]
MPTPEDEANHVFMESLIYEGGGSGIPFDPDEKQSQDDRTPFMVGHDGIGYPFGEDMADPLMADQHGLGTWGRGEGAAALEDHDEGKTPRP